MKTYIGIDPGANGAVAIIITEGSLRQDIEIIDCPSTIAEMATIFRPYCDTDTKAIIEKVNPFFKSSAKSAFTFGGNFFAWQAILASFLIPYVFITPRKWQNFIFDSAKKLDNTKQQSFERATRLFPNLELKTKRGKILDGRCDAVLLAETLKRMEKSGQI